ncbi:hypothetical protein PMAYCL1PPCAC_18926, partial [Pristionchus mayeri]
NNPDAFDFGKVGGVLKEVIEKLPIEDYDIKTCCLEFCNRNTKCKACLAIENVCFLSDDYILTPNVDIDLKYVFIKTEKASQRKDSTNTNDEVCIAITKMRNTWHSSLMTMIISRPP